MYGTVLVPQAVAAELRKPTTHCPPIDVGQHAQFQVRHAVADPRTLGVPQDLDPGEAEAIAIAIEAKADLILMNERKGTAVAREMGWNTIGVIGVLMEARQRQLIGPVLPLVDRPINEMSFFVSAALRAKLAAMLSE